MERKPAPSKKGALGKHGIPLAERRTAFRLARKLQSEKRPPSKKQLEALSRGLPTKQIAQMNTAAFNRFIIDQMMREHASEAIKRRRQLEV